MSKTGNYKPKRAICRFCGGLFMTGGNGRQTVCYEDECRDMLVGEHRERERIRRQVKRAKREEVVVKVRRTCLKCDRPIADGHLCSWCKKENEGIYAEAWNG
jgi:hypothetical protein